LGDNRNESESDRFKGIIGLKEELLCDVEDSDEVLLTTRTISRWLSGGRSKSFTNVREAKA
jgi:hypothetical protein